VNTGSCGGCTAAFPAAPLRTCMYAGVSSTLKPFCIHSFPASNCGGVYAGGGGAVGASGGAYCVGLNTGALPAKKFE